MTNFNNIISSIIAAAQSIFSPSEEYKDIYKNIKPLLREAGYSRGRSHSLASGLAQFTCEDNDPYTVSFIYNNRIHMCSDKDVVRPSARDILECHLRHSDVPSYDMDIVYYNNYTRCCGIIKHTFSDLHDPNEDYSRMYNRKVVS